jgi:hypothetical protein
MARHWLVVAFSEKGPRPDVLPASKGGQMRFFDAVHFAFDSRIAVTVEPAAYPPFYPIADKPVVTLRDRFGHMAQVPAGGQLDLWAVD